MNTDYPHPFLAREGWPFIAASGIVALLVHLLFDFWWALPFWLIFIFVVQFFRDPARPTPPQPGIVLAPADGRIVVVEPAEDPYRHETSLKISVFMNVFNVHSNRSPVDATVTEVLYHPGSFLNAALDKASLENERNALLLETTEGQKLTCVQIAGLVARRILCYVKADDRLKRGERYGFIRFGSRVDLYLPPDARAKVMIGDKVRAGSTVLAEFAPLPNAQSVTENVQDQPENPA